MSVRRLADLFVTPQTLNLKMRRTRKCYWRTIRSSITHWRADYSCWEDHSIFEAELEEFEGYSLSLAYNNSCRCSACSDVTFLPKRGTSYICTHKLCKAVSSAAIGVIIGGAPLSAAILSPLAGYMVWHTCIQLLQLYKEVNLQHWCQNFVVVEYRVDWQLGKLQGLIYWGTPIQNIHSKNGSM